ARFECAEKPRLRENALARAAPPALVVLVLVALVAVRLSGCGPARRAREVGRHAHLAGLGRLREKKALRDRLRLGHARHPSPEHERLVAVAHRPGMEILVQVGLAVGPEEAEPAAQVLDVAGLSSE